MIYSTKHKRMHVPGGYFHLERGKGPRHEWTATVTAIISSWKDEYGNVWFMGPAVRNPDNSIVYRFRDSGGRTLSGVSDNVVVTLRDEKEANLERASSTKSVLTLQDTD